MLKKIYLSIFLYCIHEYNIVFNIFPPTGHGYKNSTSSFLFSLKNKDNLPPFKALIKYPDKAIFANVKYGPNFGKKFGEAPDLHVSTGKYYSCFGCAYNLPEGYRCSKVSYCLLAGANEFTPSEIEVFY